MEDSLFPTRVTQRQEGEDEVEGQDKDEVEGEDEVHSSFWVTYPLLLAT